MMTLLQCLRFCNPLRIIISKNTGGQRPRWFGAMVAVERVQLDAAPTDGFEEAAREQAFAATVSAPCV